LHQELLVLLLHDTYRERDSVIVVSRNIQWRNALFQILGKLYFIPFSIVTTTEPRSGKLRNAHLKLEKGVLYFFFKFSHQIIWPCSFMTTSFWIKRNMRLWNMLYTGLTKPGEVGEVLALFQLKSPSLDSKAKLKSPCFFIYFWDSILVKRTLVVLFIVFRLFLFWFVFCQLHNGSCPICNFTLHYFMALNYSYRKCIAISSVWLLWNKDTSFVYLVFYYLIILSFFKYVKRKCKTIIHIYCYRRNTHNSNMTSLC